MEHGTRHAYTIAVLRLLLSLAESKCEQLSSNAVFIIAHIVSKTNSISILKEELVSCAMSHLKLDSDRAHSDGEICYL